MVKNSLTMPDSKVPKAYQNMKKNMACGRKRMSKMSLSSQMSNGKNRYFLVKARVSAFMKSVSYVVYAHLNQLDGEVERVKCSCKVGQRGCSKHVAARLYTVLDYTNLNLQQIPAQLTCTQLPKRWSVPSGSSNILDKAIKFENLLFDKG